MLFNTLKVIHIFSIIAWMAGLLYLPRLFVNHANPEITKETSETFNKYDIIFIDGSHHYLDVFNDITESERLLRSGGIICGDDLELLLKQCDQEFAKMNTQSDYIKDPRSGKYFHPGVTLAVGEFFGDVSSFSGFWPMRLTSSGYQNISFSEAKEPSLPGH